MWSTTSADELSSDDGGVCWTPQSDSPASQDWPLALGRHGDNDFQLDLSMSFDTLSHGIPPASSGAQSHEVILVHGFSILGNSISSSSSSSRPSHHQDRTNNGRNIGSDEHPQYFQARHVLEEWARTSCAETRQLQNQPVNLRRMAFSTAEVLQHGKPALCAAAHLLCNSLMQMTLDKTSSLFLGGGSVEGEAVGRHFYSASAGGTLPVFRPRQVTFVAHGLGIWVVKQALLWFRRHGTPLHSAATFFFDGARISSPDLAAGYLHDTAAVFALQWPETLPGDVLEGVKQHLVDVDRDFDALMADSHGECCEIRRADEDSFRYDMVRYSHQLWHYPSPLLRFFQDAEPVAEQVRKLTFLELGRNLAEAVSLRLLLLTSSKQTRSEVHATTIAVMAGGFKADADVASASGDDYDDASVASSGLRCSGRNNGPPSTPRGEARRLRMELPLEDCVPNSPRESEWSELTDTRGSDDDSNEDNDDNESVRYRTSDENVAHDSISGKRETFDVLQMDRYLGSSSAIRNKKAGGSHVCEDASRSLEEPTAASDQPCDAAESPAIDKSEDVGSVYHSIYEMERGPGHAAYNANIPRSRPYGALGLATMPSKSEATVLHDGRQEGQSHTQPQPRWRPRGPLGFATRSSRADFEHRISRGSSGRDSTSAVSVLRLYDDDDDLLNVDRPGTAVERTRASETLPTVSSSNGTGLGQSLDQNANPSQRTQRNSIMEALHELDSGTGSSLDGINEAVDSLISQLAESVHAELPVLDARWPNIRRSLRWLLRDIEFARYEGSRPAVQGHHDADPLSGEERSADDLHSGGGGVVEEDVTERSAGGGEVGEQGDEHPWQNAQSTQVRDSAEHCFDEEDYS